MSAPDQLPSDTPRLEQAALWFDRATSGPLSREDQADFDRWRSNPDNQLAFAEVDAAHSDARGAANAPDMLALRHEALSRIVHARRRHQQRGWVAVAAAACLGLAVIGTVTSKGPEIAPDRRAAQSAPAQPSAYQTAIGEQLTVALPDGSSVTLNTDSRLRLAYTTTERRLMLDRGQALFHVAKGQVRPFIVQALDRLVTAHGTTFDVRIEPDRKIKVALIEGSVSVASAKKDGSAPSILQPNHVLVASGDAVAVTPDADIDREVSWRNGLIIFEDDSLAQATAEVNRYVKTPIVLQDDKLKQIRVSGAFRTGETNAFVEALQLQFPVKVVSRDNDRIVLGSRS